MSRFYDALPSHPSPEAAAAAYGTGPELFLNPASFIDFTMLLRILRRNCWWILLATAAAIALTGLVLHSMQPRYRAEAILQIPTPPAPLLGEAPTVQQQSVPPDDATVNSEIDAVTAVPVLDTVIRELKLDQDPEFNPALRSNESSGLWASLLDFAEGLEHGAISFLVPNPQVFGQGDQRRIQQRLLRAIYVGVKGHSHILVVQVTSENPKKAAGIANTLATAFLANRLTAKQSYTEQITAWLNNRLAELRDKVTESERQVEQLRASTGKYEGQTTMPLLSEQLSQITRQLIDTQAEQSSAAAKVAQLSQLDGDNIGAADGILASPLISSLREQKASLDVQLVEEKTRLGPKHPYLISTESQVAQIDREIANQVAMISKNAFEQLRETNSRVAALQQSKGEVEHQIDVQNAELVHMRGVQASADSDRKAYEAFAIYRDKLVGANQVQQAEAELLSPAIPPIAPSYPRSLSTIAMVGFGALLLGIIAALLRRGLDDRLRNAQDVRAFLGIPTLALIPKCSSWPSLDSGVAEGVRYLYTELDRPRSQRRPFRVLISSSLPREGKSTVATMLAREAASNGHLTLLIDLDIRQQFIARSGADHANALEPHPEIASPPFEPSLELEPATGLKRLSFNTRLSQPFKLLYTQPFWQEIDTIMSRFDLVIIDSPPILSVPDAKIIAGYVDTTVFIVKWGATRRSIASEGLRQFQAIDAHVSGVVLTQVQQVKSTGYYYGNYADA